jgi:glucose-6-phosphate isomerase
MELDLQSQAGLPVYLDRYSLEFDGLVVSQEVDVRTLGQMTDVVLDGGEGNRRLYYMYRDIRLPKDEKIIRERGLRYDITVIPPGKIGREYIKTAGHYHPNVAGSRISYPEVYEVLVGEADYLLQKKTQDSDEVERVILIKAGAGDKVFIPPGYGHITINSSSEVLVMANWVARGFSSVYEPIKRKKGGAYFQLEENGQPLWIPNYNYLDLPSLEKGNTEQNKEFAFQFDGPLYSALDRDEGVLAILVKPHLFH